MLKAENLSISIKADETAVRLIEEVNFNLNPKTIYSIVGKNGSGKTTLIKSLTNLLDKSYYLTEGTVVYKNLNLLSAGGDDILSIRKKDIKYVFQDSINAFDPLRKLNYYFKDYLESTELKNLMKHFLFGSTREVLNLYPHQLSGGMAQRLAFILALISKPEILFLDEPTSGIDYPIINLLLNSLKDFIEHGERIIIIVTHDYYFAKKLNGMTAELSGGRLSGFIPSKNFFAERNLVE